METTKAMVLIKGKVQGVWYRASTKEQADRLGLSGWVRNLPLRRVEAVFQGPKDKVEQALQWCWQGPSGAQVSGVEVSWQDVDPELKSFEIHY